MTSDSNPTRPTTTAFALWPDQLLFTTAEAADVLRVGRTTVYALIGSGELRPIHIGRSCRISRGELERYVATLDSVESPPTPAAATHRGERSRPRRHRDKIFKLSPPPPDAA